MKYLMALLALVFAPLFSKAVELPKDEAQTIKPVTIKVLLQDKQASLLIEVNGAHRVFCPHSNVLLSSSSFGKRDQLFAKEEGLSWGKLLPGTQAIRIVPIDGQTTIFVNGVQYKGCLELYDIGGALRAINEVDVESYLRSCLATKFTAIQESEVLDALVITARTYAYYLVEKGRSQPWHITAEESGYQGLAVTLQHLAMEKAVTQTSHAILTYHKHPFAACYTENSAGRTASFSSIFRKKTLAPQGVVLSGMEAERQKSAWSFQISKQEFSELFQLPSPSALSVFTDKASGKVYAVKVAYGQGSKTFDFPMLQRSLGINKLKSNDFTIEETAHFYRFQGYGEGMGVGLCLHTAHLLAQKGLDAKKILSTFFADTTIEKLKNLPNNQKDLDKNL
ncbi:MAG: SpoIID/LytB domain-containing protein [Chlamydiae bacterium]|nr:SpoIID/LytB domain-containing protein [Chlamydiota bacterium]